MRSGQSARSKRADPSGSRRLEKAYGPYDPEGDRQATATADGTEVVLGGVNPKMKFGWARSLHFDIPRGPLSYHFNAEIGPFRYLNHAEIPRWLYPMGSTSALRSLGRATLGLGLALTAYDIATAAPCDRNLAIAQAVGGASGGLAGAFGGSLLLGPGVGTIFGGTVGSLLGNAAGALLVGSSCQSNCAP